MADIMSTFHEMAYTMREQVVVANSMMERQPKENPGGNLGGVVVDLEYLKFAEF